MKTDYYYFPRGRRFAGAWLYIVMGLIILSLTGVVTLLAYNLKTRPVLLQRALPQKVEELNLIRFRDRILLVRKDVPLNVYQKDAYWYENDRLFYFDGETEAAFGIDVSYAQDEIDWAKVKSDGVSFAMLRIGFRGYSEGLIVTDNFFEQNISGASEVGIDTGVYFFSQALNEKEAREEAKWVIETLKGYKLTYPVVFDWEFYWGIEEARTNNMDSETLTSCAIAFCDEIEKAGYTPMIYFNMSLGYLYYDLSEMQKYDFWLAELGEPPIFHYNFQMLQYSHTGKVDGIEGEVDLNISFIDYAKKQS